jgi:hypothetical protein
VWQAFHIAEALFLRSDSGPIEISCQIGLIYFFYQYFVSGIGYLVVFWLLPENQWIEIGLWLTVFFVTNFSYIKSRLSYTPAWQHF